MYCSSSILFMTLVCVFFLSSHATLYNSSLVVALSCYIPCSSLSTQLSFPGSSPYVWLEFFVHFGISSISLCTTSITISRSFGFLCLIWPLSSTSYVWGCVCLFLSFYNNLSPMSLPLVFVSERVTPLSLGVAFFLIGSSSTAVL
eukprot:Gb_33337 [translate_table: standard]